jgi:ribosomal protein L37AE/L43A
MSSKFVRTKENFICENCGQEVIGTGYTNHCPVCLWSKHVDITPGDRASLCGGLMEPVAVETVHGAYSIRHRCIVCGYQKVNRVDELDDPDALVAIVQKR